ncbi:hypothetical protein H7J55_25850 [Mycolicibacterium brisbanense]|uniref:Magnesium transporter n=1 Tax=Mycolicibacterium brisbanense TaxID=146020 RepID=A0A100VY02_9MYCO|nr:hypothetical protein [Mycolicibacterium brisbanense]GAS88072.1 magnesium transporter [Mycolicibacterium brisbanense]
MRGKIRSSGHRRILDLKVTEDAELPGSSAPMIATIVDGTGLLIYFLIAHLTLPQLAGL